MQRTVSKHDLIRCVKTTALIQKFYSSLSCIWINSVGGKTDLDPLVTIHLELSGLFCSKLVDLLHNIIPFYGFTE
jgi:hypothetical protein